MVRDHDQIKLSLWNAVISLFNWIRIRRTILFHIFVGIMGTISLEIGIRHWFSLCPHFHHLRFYMSSTWIIFKLLIWTKYIDQIKDHSLSTVWCMNVYRFVFHKNILTFRWKRWMQILNESTNMPFHHVSLTSPFPFTNLDVIA